MKLDEAAAALKTLRDEFDAAFARAPQVEQAKQEMLLAIRVGADGYALRMSEIGGLHADKLIVPISTPLAELKGIASFRGRVAPVYDLAGLLGYAIEAQTRWLVLARRAEPVALGFAAFEAHFSVASGEIVRAPGTTLQVAPAQRPTIFDAVRYGNAMRPIIDLPALVAQRIVESVPPRSMTS